MASRSCSVAILLCALATLSSGFEMRGRSLPDSPTAEDCMKPPMRRHERQCCNLPKERIWGDLRPSMDLCFGRIQQEPMRGDDQEMVTPTTPSTPDRRGRGHGGPRKPLSERLKEIFSTVYKDIKNTINSIRQSVVIITDHFRRRANDSCFMECVFEDQGFVVDKILNKSALLERLTQTLGGNDPWYKAAIGAVETCYETELPVSSNKTCSSGSEEMFRCIFKQIFFNCPNWTPSEYCMSLRAFYQKCPNGPPPELNDNHPTSPMPSAAPPAGEEEDMENNPSTDSELNTTPAQDTV